MSSLKRGQESLVIEIKCRKILEDVEIGDSIGTNGVCLTAIKYTDMGFSADCMYETLERSNLKNLKVGDKVNLERAMKLSDRLGGHLVTGDVECLGKILSITTRGIARVYSFEIPNKYGKYIVEKGRVTIDGASLTVVEVKENRFSVSLIPHTQDMITLGKKRVGDIVNIETDIIGKYIENFLFSSKKGDITMEFLLENGF